MEHKKLPIFSVQYHPEAAPGPHDASHHFDKFINMMENSGNNLPKRTDIKKILIIGSVLS